MSTQEILEKVENIKEKISDNEYMDLVNILVKKRKIYKDFYKIDYIVSKMTRKNEETILNEISVNYTITTKRKHIYVPMTEIEVQEILDNPEGNNNLFDIFNSSDFNLKDFININYNEQVKIDIQSRNYHIISIEKVEL
jgi:hypothetical protein